MEWEVVTTCKPAPELFRYTGWRSYSFVCLRAIYGLVLELKGIEALDRFNHETPRGGSGQRVSGFCDVGCRSGGRPVLRHMRSHWE